MLPAASTSGKPEPTASVPIVGCSSFVTGTPMTAAAGIPAAGASAGLPDEVTVVAVATALATTRAAVLTFFGAMAGEHSSTHYNGQPSSGGP